ncbi:MAG: aminoacyl-tRNA hydrolase [Lachnospiraceae bacterium]
MYLIAGLGNPTKQYEHTRHNVGFDAIDALAKRYGIDVSEKKFHAVYGKGVMEGQKVILAKPMTYMNLSGDSLVQILNYYKIDAETEMIVLFDDISLAPGNIRIRKKGSAGGHNGIKSIISRIGTSVFLRVKIGVGDKPKNYDLADYVLGRFSKEERVLVEDSIIDTENAVALMTKGETEQAMNLFNARKREQP